MPTKKLIALLAAGVVVAPSMLAYASSSAASSKAKTTKPTSAEVTAGRPLYEEKCAGCHGVRGEGTAIGPGFRTFQRAQTIKGVVEQLTKPLEPKTGTPMENFNRLLTTQQKEALGAYVTVELTKTVKVVK